MVQTISRYIEESQSKYFLPVFLTDFAKMSLVTIYIRDAAGQKFLTRGSGRVIDSPVGSGRVGSAHFCHHLGSGRAGSALIQVGTGWVKPCFLRNLISKVTHFYYFSGNYKLF